MTKIIDVKSTCGAKGDGQTDDTNVIQQAVNSHLDGGVIYFPAGIYIIKSPILIQNDHVRIRGAGFVPDVIREQYTDANGVERVRIKPDPKPKNCSIIRYNGGRGGNENKKAIFYCARLDRFQEPKYGDGLQDIQIENIVLDGSNQADYGLFINRCIDGSTFRRIRVTRTLRHGVLALNIWSIKLDEIHAFENWDRGITVGTDYRTFRDELGNDWGRISGQNNLELSNLAAVKNGQRYLAEHKNPTKGAGSGISLFLGSANVIRNIACERNMGPGLFLSLISGPNSIDGVYLEKNGWDLDMLPGLRERRYGLYVHNHYSTDDPVWVQQCVIKNIWTHRGGGDDWPEQWVLLTGNEPKAAGKTDAGGVHFEACGILSGVEAKWSNYTLRDTVVDAPFQHQDKRPRRTE